MTRARTFDQLSRELKNQLRQKNGWEKLSESVNGISEMISAIFETDGDDWVNRIQGLDEGEKHQFRDTFHPYLPMIREYVQGTSQQGGADPESVGDPSSSPSPSPQPTNGQESSPLSMMTMMPVIDLDAAFTGLINKTDQLNQTAEYLSSQYGLTRLERDYDTQGDFQVVPQFLTTLIGSTGPSGMAVKEMLDKLKVPYRFIVFLVYLYLDISRLTASTMGYSTQQKVLTVVLALLELFRGDWKKAVLTFMGFYGTTPLLAGQIGKVLLYLFERLSPTIQDRMVYGAWDASKSLLVGVLLSIFQLTAPLSVRKPFMEMLETLAKGKKAVDATLIEAGLEPRSDDFEPTWENINRLQAVNRDPVFICSCEYQEVIKNIGDSALVKLLLQLLGLPVNEEMKKKYTCVDRMPCKPFVEALRAEQKPAGSGSEALSAPSEALSAPSEALSAPSEALGAPTASTVPPPPFNSGQPAPPSSSPPPPFNAAQPAPPTASTVPPPPFNSAQSAPPSSSPVPPPPFNSGQPAPTLQQIQYPQMPQLQYPQLQYPQMPQMPQLQYPQMPQLQYPQIQYPQMPQLQYPPQQPLKGGRKGRITRYQKKRSTTARRVSRKKHQRR